MASLITNIPPKNFSDSISSEKNLLRKVRGEEFRVLSQKVAKDVHFPIGRVQAVFGSFTEQSTDIAEQLSLINPFLILQYEDIPKYFIDSIHELTTAVNERSPLSHLIRLCNLHKKFIAWFNKAGILDYPLTHKGMTGDQAVDLLAHITDISFFDGRKSSNIYEELSNPRKKIEREGQLAILASHIATRMKLPLAQDTQIAFDRVMRKANADLRKDFPDVHMHPSFLIREEDIQERFGGDVLAKIDMAIKENPQLSPKTIFQTFFPNLCKEFIEWFNETGLSREIFSAEDHEQLSCAREVLYSMSQTIFESSRQFIIAHELGHVYLEHLKDGDPIQVKAFLAEMGMEIDEIIGPQLSWKQTIGLILSIFGCFYLIYHAWKKYNYSPDNKKIEKAADLIGAFALKNGEYGAKDFEMMDKMYIADPASNHPSCSERAKYLRVAHQLMQKKAPN